MTRKETHNGSIGLPMLIVSVLVLTGALATLVYGPGWAWVLGALFGFLIGVAVLATVEYASIKIRRN